MVQGVSITNNNLLFHFSDPRKKMLHKFLRMNSPVKTLINRRLDWSVTKSMTKLKAHASNSICQSFFCRNLNERNSRSSLEVSRIDRFPFSIAMEAPPHVHAEALFYKIETINLYF